MKTALSLPAGRQVLLGGLALACLCVTGCRRSSEAPPRESAPLPQRTSARADPGIPVGATGEEVERRLGKPDRVGRTYVTSFGAGPHKLYIYDRRPAGVLYVQFDDKQRVMFAEWRDR